MSKDINAVIVKNFQDNIEYFQLNHPSVFKKLSAYENAVANGHYQEKYELVYENGDFDIYEKSTQLYLYKKEPNAFVSAIVKSIDKSREHNVFVANNKLDKNLVVNEMSGIGKFVFFGIGNATHISKIVEKFRLKSIFIVEDDLELFRLSLMSINYASLSKISRFYFGILEDKDEFKNSSEVFLRDSFFYNNYIKFLQLPSSSEDKLKEFHAHIATQSHLNFSYKSILEQYTKPIKYLKNGYMFLNILKTKLPDIPTILIAPGPSLSRHIAWLEKHQNSFLLVALSATLPILKKYHIVPDIITHIDGFDRSKKHFDALESLDFISCSSLLFSARTSTSILDMFDKKRIFLFENGTDFKDDFGNFSAFCAGSSSYLLSLVFSIQELYLLGLDLAVDQKTLKTHAEDYVYNLNTKNDEDNLSFRNSLVQTQGNFSDNIKTTPNFTLSINAVNEITLGLKENSQKVYNLNYGAYFKNVQPLKIEDVKIFQTYDKNLLREELFHIFKKNSEAKLSKTEKNKIEKMNKNAKNIEKFLMQEKDKTVDEKELLEITLINLFEVITKDEETDTLALVLKTYCFSYYPRFFDILNSDENVNFKELYFNLLKELLEIVRNYIKAINE